MQQSSFRIRMQSADEALAEAAQEDPLHSDPWFAPTSRLKGKVDWLGVETIQTQQICDALEIPTSARRAGLFRRLTKLMQAHGWSPIRIKLNGVDGGGVTERVRGYERQSNKLPVQVGARSSRQVSDRYTVYL